MSYTPRMYERPLFWFPWLPALGLCLLLPFAATGAVLEASHDLHVRLDLADQSLEARDNIRLINDTPGAVVTLGLSPRAKIHSLRLNGRALDPERKGAHLLLRLPEMPRDATAASPPDAQATKDESPEEQGDIVHLLEIEYSCRFDDTLPEAPASFDNPGFGVTGVIAPQGAFLMAGSGWHPWLDAVEQHFDLRVTAPKGLYAVTTGDLDSLEDSGDESVSAWRTERAREPLPLCVGAYVVETLEDDATGQAGPTVMTFFHADNADLADRYLQATARHLAFYGRLHGPYPFSTFAVVQNFFPTGYGFPGFTLLGGEVLRLPFIPETSLRHEVAHCWWGNGVLVDYARGNWCEGLTTYVADYLSKELKSPLEARDYRLQVLRDFTLLASGDRDFPLRRFASRTNPASRAVGYGKAMFVFHMLRHLAGDEPFWDALRTLHAERLFLETSWQDIGRTFARKTPLDQATMDSFLGQWVERAGAPVLWLEEVKAERSGTGWRVSGRLRQKPPFWDIQVPLRLTTADHSLERRIRPQGGDVRFSLESAGRPLSLQADPDADVFRLLHPEEIPATVNTLKGAKEVVGILCAGQEGRGNQLARLLAGLSQPRAPIVEETALDRKTLPRLEGKSLVFFGYPRNKKLRALLPQAAPGVTLSASGFGLSTHAEAANRADTLFVALGTGGAPAAAMLLPRPEAGDESVAAAVRKITHYGKYSYLAFSNGENLVKGIWPPAASPLEVRFEE
jgi:hypothetical protein